MQELTVRNKIVIHASASKVWDALTNPEQTKKYMFGAKQFQTGKLEVRFFGRERTMEKKWFL